MAIWSSQAAVRLCALWPCLPGARKAAWQLVGLCCALCKAAPFSSLAQYQKDCHTIAGGTSNTTHVLSCHCTSACRTKMALHCQPRCLCPCFAIILAGENTIIDCSCGMCVALLVRPHGGFIGCMGTLEQYLAVGYTQTCSSVCPAGMSGLDA